MAWTIHTGGSRQIRIHTLSILLGLAAVTLALYAQVFHHEFLTVDDLDFIVQNPRVRAGLNFQSLAWAFTNFDAGLWQPLSWISWMTDCQLFGMQAGWHHLMNVFYHLLNVFLLFIWLRKATGSAGKAACAAFLFSIHPLRVESVAWVMERKDTLSGLFWILSLIAYTQYAKTGKQRCMAWTAFFFALGSMAKPMVISLPIALLLLDQWPLNRSRSFFQLCVEKIPLGLIAGANAVMTCVAAHAQGAIPGFQLFPLDIRIGNALVSYVRYLGKTFFPIHLAFFYPYPPKGHPAFAVISAALFLIGITVLVFRLRKKLPFLFTGWLWFLITLLPVIGIMQNGAQSMADRYTYIPHMGLCMALVWGASAGLETLPASLKNAGKIGTALILGLLALISWRQIGYWQSSLTLAEHALAVTHDNDFAHSNLGLYYERKGDFAEAAVHYAQSLKIHPANADVLNNLGNSLLQMGQIEAAEQAYRLIEKSSGKYIQALVNLGIVFSEKKEWEKSKTYFQRALEQDPQRVKAYTGLANIEIAQHHEGTAETYLEKALQIAPEDEEANYLAGNLETSRGNYSGARPYYEKTLQANPSHFKAAYNLGNIFFLAHDDRQALHYYEKALAVNPEFTLASQQAGKARLRLQSKGLSDISATLPAAPASQKE